MKSIKRSIATNLIAQVVTEDGSRKDIDASVLTNKELFSMFAGAEPMNAHLAKGKLPNNNLRDEVNLALYGSRVHIVDGDIVPHWYDYEISVNTYNNQACLVYILITEVTPTSK
jgi:hypothetical protein